MAKTLILRRVIPAVYIDHKETNYA